MKLLLTGATGFLGLHVAAEASRRGDSVRAVVRPATDARRLSRHAGAGLELARVDLRSREGLTSAICGVDVVVHLAADKFGDFYTQFAANVVATENLLEAMAKADVRRLVAVSTGSLYDLLHTRAGSELDEDALLERHPDRRDEYTHTKLLQEQLVLEYADRGDLELTVLRPGVIFGAGNLWNAWLGAQLSPGVWIRMGAHALVPLTYVENCAEAVLLAAASRRAIGETLNVIDDDLPTQRDYVRRLALLASPSPTVLPISWTALRVLARAAHVVNAVVFRGEAKVPGILTPARLHARCKPLRYPNRRIKDVLGWTPRFDLAEAIARSLQAEAAASELEDAAGQRTPEVPEPDESAEAGGASARNAGSR